MAYSKEFSTKVLSACNAGEEVRKTVLRFGVSESWIVVSCGNDVRRGN